MGDEAYSRDEIDICGFLFLQLKEDFGKSFGGYDSAGSACGYAAVLAEYAFKVTSGKKHRAGSVFSRQAGFFPHMPVGFCTEDLCIHSAEAFLSRGSVCVALSRTEAAVAIVFSGIDKVCHGLIIA